MDVVAQRIAGVVLHVADEDVVPVDDVERAVGRELEVHGAEVAVGAFQQILAVRGFPAGAVFLDLVLLDAEEADGVAQQDVALDFIREMARRNDLDAGSGPHGVALRR